MEKITYGAPRLVDWVAQIKSGSATVRVHFSGGALTAYGVTPAEYTTSDPFIQKVIERSSYFREGRIILLRRTGKPDKPKTSNLQKAKAQLEQEPAAGTAAPLAEQPTTVIEVAETVVEPEPVAEARAEETSTAGFTKVEVTCLPDAQAYLQENFNIPSYKVRNCETAQLIAAEHGIQFTGGKFDTLNGSEAEDEAKEEE